MTKISIDIMGSDKGPKELSKACIDFLKLHDDVYYIISGDENTIKELFKDVDPSRYEIIPTDKIIPMEVKPLEFLRAKTSSMYQAINAVKEGRAQGVISSGSTGGFITGCSMLLRNIPGVPRAGLASPFPTAVKGRPMVALDIGANNVNTAEDLYGFARMGRIYAQDVLNMGEVSTYVLSNGVEEGKGTDEVVGAYKLLKERNFPGFKGNCEARYALDGKHDLIVTSGFVGNVFLKAIEGTGSLIGKLIKDVFKGFWAKLGYLFVRKGMKNLKSTMNYKSYGGGILLGVNGVGVKSHGNADAYAFFNGLDLVYKTINTDIVKKIKEEFAKDNAWFNWRT